MAEIFLFRGFELQEINEGRNSLVSQGENPLEMIFVPVTDSMLDENVEKLLNQIDKEGSESKGGSSGSKVVIMAVHSQDKALKVMRTYKALMENPGEAAFAMITPTSLTWTLGYYMDHVTKEHEYMKTHNPSNDPDMKKIT